MRLIIKFKSFWLSAYLIETWEVGLKIFNWNELAISTSNSLCTKWLGNKGSHKLFLILKSPIIMRILLILASVSLKLFEKNLNVFTKWETKKRKSYVDISDNSQQFLRVSRVFGKD